MEYGLTVLMILILCAALLFTGLRGSSKAQAGEGKAQQKKVGQIAPEGNSPALVIAQTAISKEEIAQRLRELAQSPPPKELKMGAMCYEMTAPPERINYICPRCGNKTLYAKVNPDRSGNVIFIESDIPECRRAVKAIKALSLELDESEFCRYCSPRVSAPALKLIVKYPGKSASIVTRGVNSEDLRILSEFLAGRDRHAGETGRETPLKDYLTRLEEMLGIAPGDLGIPSGGKK
jgi:hypothetical protein